MSATEAQDRLEADLVRPFINPNRQAPSQEQIEYATDLCETELEFPQRTIDGFATMSRFEMSNLISNLRVMRVKRLRAQPRDRRWRLVL